MIELFTIPKEHIKMFFDWPMQFTTKGLELNIVDDCVWYSLIDTANTEFLKCKLHVTPVNKGVVKVDSVKLIKTYENDFTFFIDGNLLVYKTKNGKHKLNTLADPQVKTTTLNKALEFPANFTIEKDYIKALYSEVLDLVKKTKDASNYIIFEIENKKLKVYNKDLNDYHEYEFPMEVNSDDMMSAFSVDLIDNVLYYYNEFDTITVGMGTDFPMQFKFKKEGIEFESIVTPRIEKE